MKKIKKGGTVEIINTGSYYPTHDTAARNLKATKWSPNIGPERGEIGTVVNIWVNWQKQIFYLIDLGDKEIIMDNSGIKLKDDWDEEYNSEKKKTFMKVGVPDTRTDMWEDE